MAEALLPHIDTVQQKPSQAPVRIAVAGVGGYAGGELARLLLRHPRLADRRPLFLGRADETNSARKGKLFDLHPHLGMGEELVVSPFQWELLKENAIDMLLLATPHEQSRAYVPQALDRGMRVIDLSGAWRLRDAENRAVYHFEDESSRIAMTVQKEAVYGSPELHKDSIAHARLVANPGCYATSIILALAPLLTASVVDLNHEIVCDAKSGVSGAGKTPSPGTHFMHAADNLSAYTVFGHRHIGEMLEQLRLADRQIRFTPHLLPIPRGILSTIHLRVTSPSDAESLCAIMREFYRGQPFVRVRKAGTLPQIQHVIRSNFCDLGVAVDSSRQRVVIVSCLDNLVKGAAGQAIQNLNLMCGWEETEGLL